MLFSGLASPQSTTRVSPYLPTITLAGLMSRCSTPREWAYSMVLQTSRNRRSSLLSSSERRPGPFFRAGSVWKRSIASFRLSPWTNRMA